LNLLLIIILDNIYYLINAIFLMLFSLGACVKTVLTVADYLRSIDQHSLRTQIAGVNEL